MILIGTGSEVSICLEAQEKLAAEGVACAGREHAFLGTVRRAGRGLSGERAAAGRDGPRRGRGRRRAGLGKVPRPRGRFVGLNHFGASAPGATLYKAFGLTADSVVAEAKAAIQDA